MSNPITSAFNLFRSGVSGGTPANAATSQITANAPAQTAPAASEVSNTPQAEAPATPVSPLDAFSKVWDSSGVQPDVPDFSFNVTPDTINKAVANMDFKSSIPPQLLAAVEAGGSGAATALADIINHVQQKSMAQNTHTTTQLIEQALNKQSTKFLEALPKIVQRYQVNSDLQSSNPVFAHPSVKPIIENLERNYAAQNPNASASEVKAAATQFFDALSNTLMEAKVSNEPKSSKSKGGNDFDFSTFLN
jgi:hypothetical protein